MRRQWQQIRSIAMIRPILRTASALLSGAAFGYEITADNPQAWLPPTLLILAFGLAIGADRIDRRHRRHRTPVTRTITWAPLVLLLILVTFRALATAGLITAPQKQQSTPEEQQLTKSQTTTQPRQPA